MIELGSFRNTRALEVTADSAIFTAPGPFSVFVVTSDRSVMIQRNVAAVDENAFLLREGQYARITLGRNETLTYALADGEIDGSIYITES